MPAPFQFNRYLRYLILIMSLQK